MRQAILLSKNGLSATQVTATVATELATPGSDVRIAINAINNRGLLPVNPSTTRVIKPPGVMASPPSAGTFTGGVSDVASGISDAVRILPNDPRIRIYGGAGAIVGAGVDATYIDGRYVSSLTTSQPFSVDMETDAQVFEIITKANGGRFMIYVDGEAIGSSLITTGSNTNYACYKYTLAATGRKRISAFIGEKTWFGGFHIGPTDSVRRSSYPLGPRVIWMGDSYVGGGGVTNTNAHHQMTYELGRIMGWPDFWGSGLGGTGFRNPNVTDSRVRYGDRVVADVIVHTPDIVIVSGSLNDDGYAGLSVPAQQAAAEAVFTAIRTALPDVTLIGITTFHQNGSPSANTLKNRDGNLAAMLAYCDLTIDPIVATSAGASSLGWITGTGKVGATTGAGNADRLIASDGTHPSDAGHVEIAGYVASAYELWQSSGCLTGALASGGTLSYP